MRRVQKFAIVVGAVFAVLTATIAWIAGTTSGIRCALWIAAHSLPHFSYGEVQGNLFSLRLTKLQYVQPGVSVRVGVVQWRWFWKELFSQRVHVRNIALDDLRIDIDSGQFPPTSQEQGSLQWNMHAWEALLENIKIDSAQVCFDGETIAWSGLHLGALLNQTAWSVFAPTLVDFRYVPTSQQQALTNNAPSIRDRIRELAKKPLIGEMIHWTAPITLAVYDFEAENMAMPSLGITGAVLELSSKIEQSRVGVVSARMAVPQWGEVQLQGSADLSQDVPIGFTAQWAPAAGLSLPFSSMHAQLKGQLAQQMQFEASMQGNVTASMQATAFLSQKGTPFSVALQSPLLGISSESGDLYSLQGVSLAAKGTINDVLISAQSVIFAPGLSDAAVDLTARFDVDQSQFKAQIKQKLAGKVILEGSALFNDSVEGKARIAITQWDLFSLGGIRQHTDISGTVNLSGSWSPKEWCAKIAHTSLTGKIGTSQLHLVGTAEMDSLGRWQISKFDANVGDNHVLAQGLSQGDAIKAALSVKAPNLHQIDLRLMGRLMADVALDGTLDRPVISGTLQADNFGAFGAAVRKMHIDAKSQAHGKNLSGDFQLTAQDLSVRGFPVNELRADLTGDIVHHRSNISWKANDFQGDIHLSGGWDGKTGWKGQLQAAQIDSALGPWSLRQSVPLTFSLGKKSLRIAMHCWRNPNADICLAQDAQVGSAGNAVVDIRRWSFAMLQKWLPSEVKLQGDVAGTARISWNAAAALPVQGTLQLDGQSLSVHRMVDKKDVSLTVERFSAAVAGDPRSLRLSWGLSLDDQSSTEGSIVIADPVKKAELSGHVLLRSLNLSRFNILLAQGDNVQGIASADIALSGSLKEPMAIGSIQADSLLFTSSKMPFVMRPSHLLITLNGRDSQLQGEIHSEKGSMQLVGTAQWPQAAAWKANLRVQGKSFAIFVRPYVHAVIDSDITIDASLGGVKIAGEVNIPQALARVNDLPASAVAASQDEVMLDAAYRPIERPQPPVPVFLDVLVKLGDHVDVRAFGLRTRLVGSIRILQSEKGLASAGKIELKDGRFTSYGQDLEVRKGEFSFAGSPTDPILSVEAIRNPESTEDGVTAGVRVTGRASKPKVEVFADPAQPQQTALSYLLTGSAGDTQGKDKNAAMTSMLIGLGASSAGQMIGALGSSIGIEDLSIGTEGTGTDSEVVVSGYILPGLQVKYGVGIFDSLATITLRYRLLPQFYVEVATGMEQAVSLLYEFDF